MSRHRQRLPRRQWRKVVSIVAAAFIVAGAAFAGFIFAAAQKYDNNVSRIDAFKRSETEQQARPRPRVDGPLTFLVVGSDSRAQDSTDAGEWPRPAGSAPTRSCWSTCNAAFLTKGVNHLDGKHALDYVRQRYGLPEGDFDRIKRQHQFLFALLAKAGSTGTLANPVKLNAFLDAATNSITVDNELGIVDLAFQLRSLRPANFTFLTTPIGGYDTDPTWGSILVPYRDKAAELFQAVSDDTLPTWVAANPVYASDPARGF